MKRYIRANTVSSESIETLVEYAERFKQSVIDVKNKKVVIPLNKGMTESMLMADWGMGTKLVNDGFNVSFEQGNFEYTKLVRYDAFGGGVNFVPETAYLKNRCIMTVTW